MMKKIFNLFLLPMIIAMQLSCKKDKKPQQAPCESTYTPYHSDSNPLDPLVLHFNAQRRLDYITVSDDRLDYRYEEKKISVMKNSVLQAMIYLEGGRAVRIERPEYGYAYTLKYNAEGQLSEIEVYGNSNHLTTYFLNYENGNLKTLQETTPGITGMKNITTYTYTPDEADQAYLYAKMLYADIFGDFIPPDFLGKQSRNVIAGSVYEYEYGDNADKDVTTFSYTKDATGKITAVKGKTVYSHYYRGNFSDGRTDSTDIRYTSTCH